ncbi:MAG: glutamate 5-kinase [Coriobacteriia bacterium]|nr:glutamate 5-kinase [Coriobacteriia bacterium]
MGGSGTSYGRVVVKVGSSLLSAPDGGLDVAFMEALVEQVARLHERGTEAVIVTSGAIAAGIERLDWEERPRAMPALQAAAAVGQVRIIGTYAELFAAHDLPVGQVLVTRHDTAHRAQYLHARDTLEKLLALGVVPVVNENDTTAVDEIRFGDNDTLAALVGTMVKADLVVLLTDIEGLYSADPRADEGAALLEHVDELTEEMLAAAGGPGSTLGSGGMATKLEAARVLMKAGIPMVVCDGRRPDVVVDAASGGCVGTFFAGDACSIGSRKTWIALGRRPAGTIVVDAGAAEAVRTRGKSLLPAGVLSVSGPFQPGDAVLIQDAEGRTVARGLVEMSSADLDRVKGLKTSEIPGILAGYKGEEVIHRDRLVLL